MIQNPCKGCQPPTRSAECHATCEAYANFVKETSSIREQAWQDSLGRREYAAYASRKFAHL